MSLWAVAPSRRPFARCAGWSCPLAAPVGAVWSPRGPGRFPPGVACSVWLLPPRRVPCRSGLLVSCRSRLPALFSRTPLQAVGPRFFVSFYSGRPFSVFFALSFGLAPFSCRSPAYLRGWLFFRPLFGFFCPLCFSWAPSFLLALPRSSQVGRGAGVFSGSRGGGSYIRRGFSPFSPLALGPVRRWGLRPGLGPLARTWSGRWRPVPFPPF